MNTRPRLLLLGLILLAFALRLAEIDAQSLWYDEGVTAQVARLGVHELALWTADDIQPPLYYLLVAGWLRLNPFGELILRLPSAAFGVLLVPLLWALGRRLWDERAGLLAGLVAAISPLMVYYGQEARMYTLLVALVTLAALAVVRLATPTSSRIGSLVVYALAGLAALYTHYFAGFALAALALYWLAGWWQDGRERRRLVEFAAANLVIVLGFLPWLPAMLTRFRADSSYWAGTLKLGEAALHTPINFTTGATEVMLERDGRAWLMAFAIAALVWAAALIIRRKATRGRPLLLLALWGFVPIVLILALAYRTPKFNPRYLMESWPAWALFVSGGLASLWSPGLRRKARVGEVGSRMSRIISRTLFFVTLFVLLASSFIGLANWFGNDNFAKSAWRDAITEMYRHRQPDEIVLLVSGHAYPVFDAYVPARFGIERARLPEIDILDVNQVLGWEETARALNEQLAGKDGVWLFLWQDEVVDPAHVTTTLLDRFAEAQPTPAYPYIGLRHYRLRADTTFPEQPPITTPGADFGGQVRLVGVEPASGGLWLYWQALAPDLPDLHAALTLSAAAGNVLLAQDQRLAGYDFPTTRWQVGETYPAWVPLDGAPAQVALRVYTAGTGETLGESDIVLP